MKTLAIMVLVLGLLVLGWIRFRPIDHDRWHVDPADQDAEENAGIRLIGREAPRFPADADMVLAALQDIALSEPGTRLLDGDPDEGMMTFISRSGLLGIPSFMTVKAVNEGASTKLAMAWRSSGSVSPDIGRERIDRWMQDMRLRLGEA